MSFILTDTLHSAHSTILSCPVEQKPVSLNITCSPGHSDLVELDAIVLSFITTNGLFKCKKEKLSSEN
jgi:hypothetical protein